MSDRIWLSPPDVDEADEQAVLAAIRSGWVAPAGPEIGAFEQELAQATGRRHAVALSSGTAALHLALVVNGIGPGSKVAVQSLTFAATANAVMYTGADPVFIDSERSSWNLDPDLLDRRLAAGDIDAVIPVDLYGQPADYSAIVEICRRHGVVLIEDAAEALGAGHAGRPAGSFGQAAVLSFNGNKIITTSGGGAYVTDDPVLAERVRHLSTQAREPAPHYEHVDVGYNYRMSNLLAGLGRRQLSDLDRRVARRRDHNAFYRSALGDLAGVGFQPEAPGNTSTCWLSVMTIDPPVAGTDPTQVRLALEAVDIEARPTWKPMHLQPVYAGAEMVGGEVAGWVFAHGLCLPSGSTLTDADRERVAGVVRSCFER